MTGDEARFRVQVGIRIVFRFLFKVYCNVYCIVWVEEGVIDFLEISIDPKILSDRQGGEIWS